MCVETAGCVVTTIYFCYPRTFETQILYLDFLLVAFCRVPSIELPSIVIFVCSVGIFAVLSSIR